MTEQTQVHPEEIAVDGDGREPAALDQERQRLAGEEAGPEQVERRAVKKYHRERQLRPYQAELIKMQQCVEVQNERVLILSEGRDASGKGGTIRRVTRYMNPRHYRVVALGRPTEEQRSQWFLQKYVAHFPTGGEIVLFDRSWYNRAGVERVMGFATEEQVDYFLKYAPAVERAIIASGVILIKYWLEVSMENQEERLKARDEDPRKIWKLSPMDLKSYTHWYDYSRARDAMFAATDTDECPWYVVDGNDKRRARLNCITHLLNQIPYEEVPHEPVKFSERQEKGDYQEPDYPYHYIPIKY